MEERNKELLEELINETLEFVQENPDNADAIEKLRTLCELSTADYAAAAKAYSDEIKADAEKQKAEAQIESEKAQIALDEKRLKFDRWFKPLKVAASVIVPVSLIHADRIGEFVNKSAVTISTKLFDRD